MQFKSYMEYALLEAQRAFDINEVPVGAVIVDWRKKIIVASSYNIMQSSNNAVMHAEILVIHKACTVLQSKYLSNCALYVTLEPCTMCAAAIALAKIGKLFYAAQDIKQGAVENGVRFFSQSSCFYKPEIYSGDCEEQSINLLNDFFKKVRNRSS